MQNNLTQDCITTSPYELFNILENDKLEKGPVEMLSPDLFAVPYKTKNDFARSHNKYNIVIALYTTAYARTILYQYMESIIWSRNHKLLYTGKKLLETTENTYVTLDTDSVIFLAPRNRKPPFEEGSMLGQMKNEYPDHDIQAFYSGGFVLVSIKGSMKKIFSCKQYGLQLCNRKTGEISHVLKCRGLTLDSTNNDKFNFSKFKEMINNYGLVPREAVCLDRDRFRPNWHKGIVLTKNCPISYSPIFDKGIFSTADAEIIFCLQGLVDELYDVYPFGYIGTAVKDPLRKFKPQL